MRRLLGFFAGLAILALFPLAATVSARVSDEGGGKVVRTAGSASGSGSQGTSNDANELSGTLSVSGSSATVTAADGTTLSCAIPTGTDLTAFVGQQVKMECENGAVREVENLATGEEIEPGDNEDENACDSTSVSSSDDEGDDDEDQCDSNSGSGDDDSGDDDSGDDDSDDGDGDGGDDD